MIAVDLQAHGRTADIDRPLSLEAMADDIAALMKHLGIEKGDVMGYSLGGGVALRTAIQHPDVVMYPLYARIAPKPADWPVLLTKLGELLRKDYDWSKEVAAIKAPTLLVFGGR